MSHSPAAQNGHGTGSGRRTIPTTRSPRAKPEPAGASSTAPSDSWPRMSRSCPGGATPYRPATISRSVAQTPSAIVRTSTLPSDSGGAETSSNLAELGVPGRSVSARIDHVHNQQNRRTREARSRPNSNAEPVAWFRTGQPSRARPSFRPICCLNLPTLRHVSHSTRYLGSLLDVRAAIRLALVTNAIVVTSAIVTRCNRTAPRALRVQRREASGCDRTKSLGHCGGLYSVRKLLLPSHPG